jgi:ABC-type lipoprotein export system ATPase subunit
MSVATPLLQLDEVTKRYPGGGGEGIVVLDRVSLELKPGEAVAVVGPSGSGKSTLLNLMGALDRPSAGRVSLAGRDLAELGERGLAQVRNRQIGFVFQAHHLLPQCTVFENVLVPSLATDNEVLRDGAPDRARRLLAKVGLGGRLGHRPGQLSGGERQRVAVVRALINEPQLVLADEPTGALDRVAADAMGQMLVELNRELGVSLVVATHSLALAALLHRTFELRDGRLREVNLAGEVPVGSPVPKAGATPSGSGESPTRGALR